MLVSTTLAGPGSADTIGEALTSVLHIADFCIVIDGGGGPEVMAAAECVAGPKLIMGALTWLGHYGDARNASLALARTVGADWAITVDCDERIETDPATDYAALMASGQFDVLALIDKNDLYSKPRFIRCGSDARWFGRVHEVLEGVRPWALAPGAFWEVPRDHANESARWARGEAWCREALAMGAPHRTRWIRHLAECVISAGRFEEAKDLYVSLRDEATHPDERSWAVYRLCELEIMSSDLEGARRLASLELGRNPTYVQEFGWILAHTNARLKNTRAAALWCEYALAAPLDLTRGGQRSLSWKQGCEQLLASIQEACARG